MLGCAFKRGLGVTHHAALMSPPMSYKREICNQGHIPVNTCLYFAHDPLPSPDTSDPSRDFIRVQCSYYIRLV